MNKFFLCGIFLSVFFLSSIGTYADDGDFDMDRWNSILNDVQTRAIQQNISPKTINDVIQTSVFIPSIVQSDKNQSEFKLTLEQYLQRVVSPSRIAAGLQKKKEYPTLLRRVDEKYGVPPNVILAFWGLESNYGNDKARHKLSDAFLTLMYDGRRQQFFDKQLFSIMKAADINNLEISEIRGSWAGAMGHFQFIPTTLDMYGADGNGDGKIDIIHSTSDAMFSAGNYLSKMGWNKNEKIIRPVILPDDFDFDLLDSKTKKTVIQWSDMGIIRADGSPLPRSEMLAGLVADTANGNVRTAYLTYPNFYRIKKWNNSNWYAIAIAMLADELK